MTTTTKDGGPAMSAPEMRVAHATALQRCVALLRTVHPEKFV